MEVSWKFAVLLLMPQVNSQPDQSLKLANCLAWLELILAKKKDFGQQAEQRLREIKALQIKDI